MRKNEESFFTAFFPRPFFISPDQYNGGMRCDRLHKKIQINPGLARRIVQGERL